MAGVKRPPLGGKGRYTGLRHLGQFVEVTLLPRKFNRLGYLLGPSSHPFTLFLGLAQTQQLPCGNRFWRGNANRRVQEKTCTTLHRIHLGGRRRKGSTGSVGEFHSPSALQKEHPLPQAFSWWIFTFIFTSTANRWTCVCLSFSFRPQLQVH